MSLAKRMSARASWLFAKDQVLIEKIRALTPARVPYLPPEIIAAIVSHIPDSPTLKSCSLVSTIFLAPAQKSLFSHVAILAKAKGVNPFVTFLDLISTKSKNLTILITSINLFDFLDASSVSWFSHDDHVMPAILSAFPNLTHLGIHSESRELAPSIQRALIDLYGRCALTSLSLRGLNIDLIDILRRSLFLTEIGLADVGLVTDYNAVQMPEHMDSSVSEVSSFCATPVIHHSPTQSTTVFHLQANISQFVFQLTRSMSPCVIENLLDSVTWPSFSRSLRVLELDLIHFRHTSTLQRLLNKSSRTVNELRICTFDLESLSFHIPSNIPKVHFHFKMVPGLYKTNPSFIDIFQPFNRLHRHSRMSQGISELRLQIDTYTAHTLFNRQPWEWAFLDEVLLCVSNVVWIVVAMVTPGEMMEEMKEALAERVSECLPRAKSKKILKVMVIG